MGSKDSVGVTDWGAVELVPVVPEVPPPAPDPIPPVPPAPTPVQDAHRATIEQTGADPPPVE